MSWRQTLENWARRRWWQSRHSLSVQLLRPLSALYAMVVSKRSPACSAQVGPDLPVPVIVVGNLVAGGAGKTPTVIALIQWLQSIGRQPGVISRGYGRQTDAIVEVHAGSLAQDVGDEPLLIHRRTQVPVVVGASRLAAAQALLKSHPQVDVVISDDGLQHRALPRQWQLLVFDERGVGNGLCLPAGPLRQPFSAEVLPRSTVLYNAAAASTAWPGELLNRQLGLPVALDDWWAGRKTVLPGEEAGLHLDPALPGATVAGATWGLWLESIRRHSSDQACLALAGTAAPERFFSMLEALGQAIRRLPLPDHAEFTSRPWPVDEALVLLTEKDAVKLPPDRWQSWQIDPKRVLVVPLEFRFPPGAQADIRAMLNSIAQPAEG